MSFFATNTKILEGIFYFKTIFINRDVRLYYKEKYFFIKRISNI